MRKRRNLVISISSLILLIVAGIFLFNFKVMAYNGKTYSAMSESSLILKADKLLSNTKISLIYAEDVDSISLDLKDLGLSYSYNMSDCKNSKNFISYYDLNKGSSVVINNESILRSYLEDLNSSLSDSVDAYYEVTPTDIILHKEIYGKKFDSAKAFSIIKSSLESNNFDIDITDSTIKPTVCETDLVDLTKKINSFKSWGISYTNGESLDFADIIQFITISNNDIVISQEDLITYLNIKLADTLKSYNTVGEERDFKKTDGNIITLSNGTYGDKVDIDSEVEFVLSSLSDITSEKDRVPEYSLKLPDEVANTYIEIDLASQHLWYYLDGSVLMESDIVTGTANTDRETPTGIYYISEKIADKYLTGATYKTWVNHWMRLTNTGVGLHDAYWRGSFGGSIYTYNGSHGCINLPKDFAKELFDIVERKTAVIIY